MMFNMLEYYQMLKLKNINIIYSGPLWAGGIEDIAVTLKKRLEADELPLSTSQSIFSVFVEQMNNMLMYSIDKDPENTDKDSDFAKGTFVLGTVGKSYFLQTGNVMKDESVQLVKDRIDYLNTLSKQELRKYYKEQIRSENSNPESKGAGLGFIEIARRASSKIEYSFTPFDEGRTFFVMYVTIDIGK